MASVANIVRFVPTAGGTADFVYSAAVTGYRSPTSSPALVNGDTYRYRAESSNLGEWEVGEGTWTAGSTTLARTTIIHSSTGAKVNFTAAPDVAIVVLDDQFINPAGGTMTGSLVVPNASGLKIKDTDASHTLGIVGGSNLTADRTLTVTTGDANRALTLTADASVGGTNTGDQNLFSTIAVSGQSNVVADAAADTLTLAAGANITITTDASTDTITIAGSASGGKAADQQVFTSSGTWTKPSGFGAKAYAFIQAWGAGGGGARHSTANNAGGGGGGGYKEFWILLSSLGATETVTIGAGGAGRTSTNGNGTAGGDTTFGSWVTAYGGGGGGSSGNMYTGIGGNNLSAGGSNKHLGAVGTSPSPDVYLPLVYDGVSTAYYDNPIINPWAGAMGRVAGATVQGGGNAVWGGASGGAGATNTAGGTSQFGGNGGTGGASPTAGSQPGGGGGAGANVNGANGAAGKIIVTVFDGA